MTRKIKDIKSVKDTLIKDIKLQYRGNTLMCIKRTSHRGLTMYTNDTVSNVFNTIKEVKEFCLNYFENFMNDIDKSLDK